MHLDQKVGNVKVVCRFRPLNQRQKAISNATIQELLDDKTVAIKDVKPDKSSNAEPLQFTFDKVFDCNSKQAEIYNYAAASVIESVIEGFNGTIFAYGQTSSGKTHTMSGQIGQSITQNSGIIPRMVVQVFQSISKCSQNIQFRIKVSMVQIYLEKIRDLIDTTKKKMNVRSDLKRGIFIQNCAETYISSPSEVYQLMDLANKSRAVASTNMNQNSSRSHLLFILSIHQNNISDMSAKTGKLYLVDLAGSEKVGKTGAQGKVLEEAKKINSGLSTLGKVINALTDFKSPQVHVPYRESVLTRVLQQSLGGNSKTTLIVTCSPHPNNISQTISTLRFGISAKKIKNKPKINKEMTVAQLQNLLARTQRDLHNRQTYINQLKDYILGDLKQKSIPVFTNDANKFISNQQQQQPDLIGELERQLQIERNLNLVQDEELTNLKEKFQKMGNQKQLLEQELTNSRNCIQALENQIKSSQFLAKKNVSLKQLKQTQESSNFSGINMENLISELSSITKDEKVFQYLREKSTNKKVESTSEQEYTKLLQDYEIQKQKCKKGDQKMEKYEKLMQKKLSQLQNNICQLTHAYYDLLIIQQRHKVDNIFLKKKLQQKDTSILTLKQRIKELQDQNRELEQQRWNDGEEQNTTNTNTDTNTNANTNPNNNANTKNVGPKKVTQYAIGEEQQNKWNELCEKRNLNIVKVVRGGNK